MSKNIETDPSKIQKKAVDLLCPFCEHKLISAFSEARMVCTKCHSYYNLQTILYANYGKAVLENVRGHVSEITADDTIFELADLAVQHELIEYVPYDKKKHGSDMDELCDVEEGDMIYWWGAK